MAIWEYDIVNHKVDKTKPWIHIKSKCILNRAVDYRPRKFVSLRTRYEQHGYEYFIIFSNDIIESSNCIDTDDYGRVRINISSIFTELGFKNTDKCRNIQLECVENNEDYDVYKIVC